MSAEVIQKNTNKQFNSKYNWKYSQFKTCVNKDVLKFIKKNKKDVLDTVQKEYNKIYNYRIYIRSKKYDDVVYQPINIYRLLKHNQNNIRKLDAKYIEEFGELKETDFTRKELDLMEKDPKKFAGPDVDFLINKLKY